MRTQYRFCDVEVFVLLIFVLLYLFSLKLTRDQIMDHLGLWNRTVIIQLYIRSNYSPVPDEIRIDHVLDHG